MNIHIPGYKDLKIQTIIFDYNGTLAVDGEISKEVQSAIIQLAESFQLYVLTADTYGSVKKACEGLPIKVYTFSGDAASLSKKEIVETLGPETCACLGNGRNDVEMLSIAGLSISVMGREGLYAPLIGVSDICVTSIRDALQLFLSPNRIVADLRG